MEEQNERGENLKKKFSYTKKLASAAGKAIASGDPLFGSLVGAAKTLYRMKTSDKKEQDDFNTEDSSNPGSKTEDANEKFISMSTKNIDKKLDNLADISKKQNINLVMIKGQTSETNSHLSQLSRLQEQTNSMLASLEGNNKANGSRGPGMSIAPNEGNSYTAPDKTKDAFIQSITKSMTTNLTESLQANVTNLTNIAEKTFSNLFNISNKKLQAETNNVLSKDEQFTTNVTAEKGGYDGPAKNFIDASKQLTTINNNQPAANDSSAAKPSISINPLNLVKSAGKSVFKKVGKKLLEKESIKIAEKGAAKFGLKTLVKKIPIIGALAGLGFGAQRFLSGDTTGALLEVGSGLASTIPGIGTAASLGIDAGLAARDAGMFGDASSDMKPAQSNIVPALASSMGMKASTVPMMLQTAMATKRAAEEEQKSKAKQEAQSLIAVATPSKQQAPQQSTIKSASPSIRSNESSFEKMQVASHWGRRL